MRRMRRMLHLLVQLSDTHIGPDGQPLPSGVDTAALLRSAVAAVLRLPQPPAAVLLSGDLVDDGSPAAYAALRELLAPLPCPVWPMPGNHDARDALRAAFADVPELQQTAGEDFIQFHARLPGLRLLALDTLQPGASAGALCSRRLAWLQAALQSDPRTPVLLALHHPPFETHLPGMDRMRLLQGAPELAALLARHPQVQRVVCGHLHRSMQRLWAGTLVQSAPSTAHHIALALGAGPASPPGEGWTLEPPGFLVHAWRTPPESQPYSQLDSQPVDARAAAAGAFPTPDLQLVTHLAFSQPAPGPFGWDD